MVHLTLAVLVPEIQEQIVAGEMTSPINEEEWWLFGIFDRAGDSTGGVEEEKGLWLPCQNMGGRATGSTAMLFSFE